MAHDSRVFVFDQDAKEENEGRVACGAKRRRKCARGGNGEKLGCTLRADAYSIHTNNTNMAFKTEPR